MCMLQKVSPLRGILFTAAPSRPSTSHFKTRLIRCKLKLPIPALLTVPTLPHDLCSPQLCFAQASKQWAASNLMRLTVVRGFETGFASTTPASHEPPCYF